MGEPQPKVESLVSEVCMFDIMGNNISLLYVYNNDIYWYIPA